MNVYMNGRLTSKKLAGAVAAMAGVVGLVIGSIALGVEEAVTAQVSVFGVEGPVVFWAIVAVAGLGGFHVLRQAQIDEKNGSGSDGT